MSQKWTVELDSPGFSFRSIIQYNRTRTDQLLKFLPDGMYETLKILEPKFEESDCLVEVIEAVNDPNDIFSNPKSLNDAITLLPPEKAVELCKKLQIEEIGNPIESILRVADDASMTTKIKMFFGLSEDKTARGLHQPNVNISYVNYGLFEHQRRISIRARRMLSQHPHRCVLHMPTGSGKTRTAMHIVASHMNNFDRAVVVWLSQSVELLEQSADEFDKAWSYLGNRNVDVVRCWGSGKVDIGAISDGFIVAGLSKMVSWERRSTSQFLKLADRTSLVIVDEAHQSVAMTYQPVIDVLASKKSTTQLLGLTATPGRTWSDIFADRELSKFFFNNKLVLDVPGYSNPVSYLMDSGYLAKPKFRKLAFDVCDTVLPDEQNVAKADDDISDDILIDIGNSAQRNAIIVHACDELVTKHKRILVFCPSVSNAKMLSAIMKLRGIESFFITADTSANVRAQKIQRYKGNSGKPIILFNFGVLSTGFDAPLTSALIIARPTRSLVLYSQMVGRAIRGVKAGGNRNAEIVTIVDTALPGFGDIADAFFNWEDVWENDID